MIDLLLKTLAKIHLIERYKVICEKHNDFQNRLDKTNKKQLLSIFKNLYPSVKYEGLDKLYSIFFNVNEFKIIFCSKLHNGIVEPFFYIGKGDNEHIFYNRFDFICVDLDENFDRKICNIPKYSSEEELEQILKELLNIYEDFKIEFLKRAEQEV